MRFGLSSLYSIPGDLTLYRDCPDANNVHTIKCLSTVQNANHCIVITHPLGKYVDATDYKILSIEVYSEESFDRLTHAYALRNDIVLYVTNVV